MSNHGGYETAASTVLIAQFCACCGRALRDAVSVERGVGPECAAKYGYAEAQGEANWYEVEKAFEAVSGNAFAPLSAAWGDAHKMANVAVHYAACVSAAEREPFIAVLAHLGYIKLAGAVAKAAGEVVEVYVGEGRLAEKLIVKTPFSVLFNTVLKAQRVGAYFDRGEKAWVVSAGDREKKGLYAALKHAFAGRVLISAKGISRLPVRAEAAS